MAHGYPGIHDFALSDCADLWLTFFDTSQARHEAGLAARAMTTDMGDPKKHDERRPQGRSRLRRSRIDRHHPDCPLLQREQSPERQVPSRVSRALRLYVAEDCAIEIRFARDTAEQDLGLRFECSNRIDDLSPASFRPVLRIGFSMARPPPSRCAFIASLNQHQRLALQTVALEPSIGLAAIAVLHDERRNAQARIDLRARATRLERGRRECREA